MSSSRIPLIAIVLCAAASATHADVYPIGGTWTYDKATEKGPAKDCGRRVMQFDGNLRHDTGTGVPEYKNVTVRQSGAGTWRVVDEFFNAIQRGRVTYTLKQIDDDHNELRLDMGGATYLLRRCA